MKEQERSFHQLPGFLRCYSLVVTTFWHIHKVQKLLQKANIEVVGPMADASLEMLWQRLAQLASGTEILVVRRDRD